MSADVFLRPSATDAAGTVVLEAQAGANDVIQDRCSAVSLSGSNTLPGGVRPVTKTATPFLDIANALSAAGLTHPEKIEGLTVGPRLNDGGHLLLLGTDNDFSVTQTGAGAQFDVCFGGALSGTQVPIGSACPSGSALLPTFLYAFRTAPGELGSSPAIPEPGALALMGAGLIAAMRRRTRP